MAHPEADKELEAMQIVIVALTPLDSEARGRVLDYVFKRLGFKAILPSTPIGAATRGDAVASSSGTRTVAPDIRTLKAEKVPHSAVEMAALVAYYLSELAPSDERRDAIGTADIEKYFKQAHYPLPKTPRFALTNAANAGYFDSVARGLYRLNPVGYNLVVHKLPSGSSERPASRSKKGTRGAQRVGKK